MGDHTIERAVRAYILRHYDSATTGKRGQIDPVEYASFLREEGLECIRQRRSVFDMGDWCGQQHPLFRNTDRDSAHAALAAAVPTTKSPEAHSADARAYDLYWNSDATAMDLLSFKTIFKQITAVTAHEVPKPAAPLPPTTRPAPTPLPPLAPAPEGRHTLLGKLFVGDGQASRATNDSETVRMARPNMPTEQMLFVPTTLDRPVTFALQFRSVDWPSTTPGIEFPSRAFIVPRDYHGALPPTPESRAAWGDNHFFTVAPSATGNSHFEVTLAPGAYRVVAQAGRKARQTDAFDNCTLEIWGTGLKAIATDATPERPVNFTERVVKTTEGDTPAADSLKGKRVEVVFAIDNSGSMQSAKRTVIANIEQIMAEFERRGAASVDCAVVTFRDEGEVMTLLSRTRMTKDTLTSLRVALNSIVVDGGGDAEEAVGEAIGRSGSLFSKFPNTKRSVIVLTDGGGASGGEHSRRHGQSIADAKAVAKGRKINIDIQLVGEDRFGRLGYRDTWSFKPTDGLRWDRIPPPPAAVPPPTVRPRKTPAPEVRHFTYRSPAFGREHPLVRQLGGHHIEFLDFAGSWATPRGATEPAKLVVESVDGNITLSLWRRPSPPSTDGAQPPYRLQWRKPFKSLTDVAAYLAPVLTVRPSPTE